ncbi:MAG: acyl-CoA synthetase (AMP-forming)/AMP-acid ligase, partial [Ilumatobacteraceae bacterium]|nr:acyl-CoA synthetase (AMP-forming)/AMP-acid ligase [Ilumatobacteraceae bacterium]
TTLDLFDAVVAQHGDREAVVHDGVRMSFAEWAARGDALAAWLIDEQVVRTGDVVGIQLPSGIDYMVAYQGIMRAGAIATGIIPGYCPTEIEHIVRKSGAGFIFDGALPDVGLGDPLGRPVDLAATDAVAIVWTGGTTGMPKGAWFDHACLRAMTLGAAPLSAPGDRRLSPLPFAHVGAMTRVWDELEHVITTVIVPSPWTAAGALQLINVEHITVSQGVPTQYRLMFDHPDFATTDVSSLRIAGIGASRVPPELVEEMLAKLHCPVVNRFASTESCVATGTRLDDSVDVICNTVGRPNGDVEVKIVDDDRQPITDTGPDAIGTVCLRGRAMMRGYWNDPERTAEAIDADGWLHTGDLGWIGADGNLRLAGRSTEMYIRGGNNVYPIEVENCLGNHPGVAASAILGVQVDDRLGEIGVLFAVARPDASLELAEIQAFVKAHLASYKAPDALVVVDGLPLTSIGKIDKVALRPRATEEAHAWTR